MYIYNFLNAYFFAGITLVLFSYLGKPGLDGKTQITEFMTEYSPSFPEIAAFFSFSCFVASSCGGFQRLESKWKAVSCKETGSVSAVIRIACTLPLEKSGYFACLKKQGKKPRNRRVCH